MKTAKLLKDNLPSFRGHAALYKLDPPLVDKGWRDDDPEKHHSYVIVSAVDAMFSGPETYIFPANEDGQIQDYGELEGSYRGGFDHVTALEGAGYAVK
jgi:hypothetical protein